MISASEHPKTSSLAGRLGRYSAIPQRAGSHLLPLGTAIGIACRQMRGVCKDGPELSAVLYVRDYLLIFKCLLDLSSCI